MRTLTLVLAMLAPAQAHALSCLWGPGHSFPEQNAVDVPVNVIPRIFIEGDSADSFGLTLLHDEEAIAVTQSVHVQGSRSLVSLEPDADLAAATDYTILVTHTDESEIMRYEFRTGDARDETAPETPSILDMSRSKGRSEWGRTDHVQVDLESPSEPMLYRMHLTDVDSGDDLGEVYTVGWDDNGMRRISAGEGLCGSDVELDGAVDVVVEAIDRAGNVSAESESGRAAGGCSATATPAALGLLFLGLGLAGLRRRRTR